MERTNYVARAKRLIAQNLITQKMMSAVRTTALVIVPLAAAVNAHAGVVVLPHGDSACSTSPSPDSPCSMSDSALPPPSGDGVQGLSFFTNSPIRFSLSSGSTLAITVTMTDDGTVSGGTILQGTNIPVSADFSLSTVSGASITNWQIAFALGTFSNANLYGSALISCTTTCSGGTDIGGSSLLSVLTDISSGSTLLETVKLTLTVTPRDASAVIVTVPESTSWDFDSVSAATTAVPEPASVGLFASGLALIGFGLRRRKR